MLNVIDHVSRIDIRLKIHNQIAERVDKEVTTSREIRWPLIVQQPSQAAVLYRYQALVLLSDKHCIGRRIAVQEDPLHAVHFLAEHQPRLAQRVKRVAAAVITGLRIGVEQQPGVVVLLRVRRVGQIVTDVDDRLEQSAVIGSARWLQWGALKIQ